jgi:DNA-binding response OmpR family regulator
MSTILLIEDENLVAGTIETVLKKAGYTVVHARDGEKGMAAFKAEMPDLVITDLIMPEKEGIQVIREIREISKDVPIIAISGGGRTQNYDFLRIAHKLGATEVLRKPFANKDLLTVVNDYLGDAEV